ncbi:MAG TPA: flavin reductase family protein [Myxococcota bacterium]
MAVDVVELKQVLAKRASGVAVVTARAGDVIHGMTVSAFAEVSLTPPLVLVCAEKSSHTHPVIARGGVFALNVLARDQAALSDRFASKKDEERRFVGLDYESGVTGAPLLAGTVATLDCRVRAAHDAGDHVIYVGEVVDLRRSERAPLVYYGGAYRELARPE